MPEHASSVFSLGVQKLNAITECNSAVPFKAVALEHVHVVAETAAVSLACRTPEKIGLVCKRNEAHLWCNV